MSEFTCFKDLAFGRRSIRKFQDKDIPLEDIKDIIKIASSAPSGCDSQCWRFIAVKDRPTLEKIAEVLVKKVNGLLEINMEKIIPEYFESKRKMLTFFLKAPVVVAVFMTRLNFYDPVQMAAFEAHGYSHDDIMKLLAYPDLLSIGAAVQNLLLAVHEKGYGACWMNEPAIADKEITEILGEPEDSKFISLIPIGFPSYAPREKKFKDFESIFKSI